MESYEIFIDTTLCSNTPFYIGQEAFNTTGNYTRTLSTYGGCDSIIHLNLTAKESFQDETYASICEGSHYEYRGDMYDSSGIYIDSYQNVVGCDSLYMLHLTVHPIYSRFVFHSIDICDNDSLYINGKLVSSTGVYVDSLSSLHGCDSIVFKHFTVHEAVPSVIHGKTDVELFEESTYSVFSEPSAIYNFYPEKGITTNATNNSISVQWIEEGIGYVELVETNPNGCQVEQKISITIGSGTGIEARKTDSTIDIAMYPNPTRGKVFFDNAEGYFFKLFNLQGQIIKMSMQPEVDLSDVKSGIYLIRIYNKNTKELLTTQKIIKD